ncbi:MAG: response regulator [Thermodesulfobacteriota bacterium]
MEPRVLLVDDDPAWLRLKQQELRQHDDVFSVVTAQDGQSALNTLQNDHVTMVVTDLRMPGIDGFELLSRIQNHYPDVAVMIITGYDRPKTRDVVLKSGAAEYLTKPVESADLARRIKKILKQKSEGGSLHNVSLETYLQLVEMEQQTCTLRVIDKSSGKMGVLFFRDGDLMDARYGDQKGRPAAYEILSWSGVSLMIETSCVIEEKQVEGELQALLLDAMRSKDESEDDDNELQAEKASEDSEILLNDPFQSAPETENSTGQGLQATAAAVETEPGDATMPANANPADAAAATGASAAPVEAAEGVDGLRKRLVDALGQRGGIRDVYEDSQYKGLLDQSATVGDIFDAGRLNVIYISQGRDTQFVIAPGEQTAIVAMEPDTPRDRVIDLLA